MRRVKTKARKVQHVKGFGIRDITGIKRPEDGVETFTSFSEFNKVNCNRVYGRQVDWSAYCEGRCQLAIEQVDKWT